MTDTKTNKVKRILSIAADVLLVLFVLFSAFVLIVALTQKAGKVSQIFGHTLRSVQSDSMKRYGDDGELMELAFCKGDLIVCEITDQKAYEIGDVVMFSMPIELYPDGSYRECANGETYDQEIFVAHAIVEVIEDQGFTWYRTQGYGNSVPDKNLKMAHDFIALYKGDRYGGLGSVIDFLQTQIGFFVCIVLPLLAFVLFQAWRVVRNIIAYNKQAAMLEASEAVAASELTEEQKRRIAEEYLRSLNQGAPSTDGSQPKGTEE